MKSPKKSTWVQSQKLQNDLSSFPRQIIQYFSNPSLCPNHWCWRSGSWSVLWRPTRHSRKKNQKRYPFNHKGLESKSRRSRDIKNNRQIWPLSTKWGRVKASGVLSREHDGHSKYCFPTTPETNLYMDMDHTWSIHKSDWLCSLQSKMKKLYKKNKAWSWL